MSCEDIDECLLTSPCGYACVNVPGGFLCECEVGYMLNADGLTCTGNKQFIYITLRNYSHDNIQRLMSARPLMVAVITTVSTLKEVLSVPVEMVLYWERTVCLVKI